MPWDWHKPIFEYAHEIGITIFSSPFDKTAVDLLEELNTPAYKIASFEAIDLPLIEYVASTSKPMIISTGMADEIEIAEAIEAAKNSGCEQLAILHCVSGYPAPAEDYNLKTITEMKNKFNLVTGLSDHTLDNNTAIASVALGASIIEKHFTLDRTGGGPDDSFSLEPVELGNLCNGANVAWSALGDVNFSRKASEKANVQFVKVLDRTHIKLKVWERGSGITLASGSSSCAAVDAGIRRELLDNRVEVELDGGFVEVEKKVTGMWLTGPTKHVFSGIYNLIRN